jgi:ribosomal-protein-alanine N-acetyltransferase
MKEKDIDQIMGIESVSFGTHHWSKQSFRSELRNKTGSYYVLCDGDAEKVIGYSGFWLIMDESHITTIAIHPDYRRKNLGELLLQNLIEKSIMRKAKWITLEVRTSNIGAQNLYYKYGFSSLGVRRKYYQDNDEDALIMWTEDIHSMKFKELFQQNVEELKPKLDSEYKFVKG